MKAKLQKLVQRLKPATVILANPLLGDRLRNAFNKGAKLDNVRFVANGQTLTDNNGNTQFYATADINLHDIESIINELRAEPRKPDDVVPIRKAVLDDLVSKAREHDSALLANAATNLTGVETDITHRWESGIEHHPQVVALMKQLKAADARFGGLAFDFKTGGDGDNGEHLMYLLDIIFEARESAKRNGPGLLEATL